MYFDKQITSAKRIDKDSNAHQTIRGVYKNAYDDVKVAKIHGLYI